MKMTMQVSVLRTAKVSNMEHPKEATGDGRQATGQARRIPNDCNCNYMARCGRPSIRLDAIPLGADTAYHAVHTFAACRTQPGRRCPEPAATPTAVRASRAHGAAAGGAHDHPGRFRSGAADALQP